MRQYYRVGINCGRTKMIGERSIDYGYIELLPVKTTQEEKGFILKKIVTKTEYSGRYIVIVEKVDDHFEDVILNKRIDYEPDGLKDINTASIEDLLAQLNKGLTYYSAIAIDETIAIYYKNMINNNPEMLEKYISELETIENKRNVVEELESRLNKSCSMYDNQIDEKPRQRVRKIKSA